MNIFNVTIIIIHSGMNEIPLTTAYLPWRNDEKYQESDAVSIKRPICTIILYKKNSKKKREINGI